MVSSPLPKHLLEHWNTLSEFVKKTCADRDESHGYQHMYNVARNALFIYQQEKFNNSRIEELTITTAWLHDVADHKYDHDGKLKEQLYAFLKEHHPEDADMIMKVIERVSYSKEVKAMQNFDTQWFGCLSPEALCIRTIVSDADKIEALGKEGFDRCVLYAQHAHKEKHGDPITKEELIEGVYEHAQEKLLHLKDKYIHTKSGKLLASPRHKELVEAIETMKKEKKVPC